MNVTALCDLRPMFGAARNQGSRPTCIAFACSDMNAVCRVPWSPLSCEYLLYHGLRRQGTDPNGGLHLHHGLDAVEHDGQPREAAWLYLQALPVDLRLWMPPADAGELFRGKGSQGTGGVAAIRAALGGNRPILLVTSISDAFYRPDADGVIDSAEAADTARVHALIGVGHGRRGQDGFILVRNSWGEAWGLAGYAWLSDRYLAPRLIELATMTKVP